MLDEPQPTPTVALERPKQIWRPWLRRLLRLGLIIGLCAVILGRRSDLSLVDHQQACELAVRKSALDAVSLCQAAYQRTHAPATGALLANALYKSGDRKQAGQVAAGLRETSARADAFFVLGKIADKEKRYDDATTALREAQRLHRLEHRSAPLAADDGVLAMLLTKHNQFAEALELIDECIMQAQLADDRELQCYCHLAAAKALIHVGHASAAHDEIKVATPLATTDLLRSDLAYQGASAEQESGSDAQAIVGFQSALHYRYSSGISGDPSWIFTTERNLAYSLAERGKLDDASRQLERAALLDPDHEDSTDQAWTAAEIAYQRGDPTSAAALVEKYFELDGPDDNADDLDDRINVAALGARIELGRNNMEPAARWAQRGICLAERIRHSQSVTELRPWILDRRRLPYELRFAALARGQHVEEAAMVFDDWQGRTVQDWLATPRPIGSIDYRGVAAQVRRLDRWLQAASRAAFARSADRDAVLDTMQRTDLLALIVADDELWSLVASHGRPRLTKIGPWREIKERVSAFSGQPTDRQLASELGQLLVPDDLFRETSEVLHVLLDSQLQGLPVAALRHGGAPLIALRPITRVLRLPETRCVPATHARRATVLAVADPGIPLAPAEGAVVAALLHTTSQTGAAATRDALLAAGGADVLHVAAHGVIGDDGVALQLADGHVFAAELPARHLGPPLVVLTACDAASSRVPELAGSLAAGFLAAGSQHVVATLRQISDASALQISANFYRYGGVSDPAHALARVQAELARTTNEDWPNMVVFGLDVCPGTAPDQRSAP